MPSRQRASDIRRQKAVPVWRRSRSAAVERSGAHEFNESDAQGCSGSCGGGCASAPGRRALRPRASPTTSPAGPNRRTSTRSGNWCATASTIRACTASTGRRCARATVPRRHPRAPGRKRRSSINAMLAELGASHTHYYTPEDPAYYQLADIFVGALERRGLERVFPKGEVTYPGIGAFTRPTSQGRTFITGVIEGAPAHQAGLLVGDEILSADDRPFRPVEFVPRQGRGPRLASDPPHVGRERRSRSA